MKKRTTALCLILALVLSVMTGCGSDSTSNYTLEGKGAAKYSVTVQGSIFGGAGDDRIETGVTFDPKWVTKTDNTKYNKDLAAFAAIVSDDVYFRLKDADKGTPNRVLYEGETEEEYDWTNLLKEVGFNEVQYIESYKVKEYAGDGNDSVTLLLAHGVVNEKYDLYVVAIRGCFSAQEWISMFDPGCEKADGSSDARAASGTADAGAASETADAGAASGTARESVAGDDYIDLTGQHSEWTDAGTYKGLDIAKNRAMEFIDEFMAATDDPGYENCVLITGHSRGGAIANMVGAEMEKREGVKPYTYTFNAPGVTTDDKATEYETVFNIFDSNDYYTDPLPFGEETFYRYGRDMTMAIADNEEVKAAIAELKGRDDYACMSAEAKAEYAELFGNRFPDRASLYEMKTVTETFESEEEALYRAETIYSLIGVENGLGLDGLCYLIMGENAVSTAGFAAEQFAGEDIHIDSAIIPTEDGKFEVKMTYCDAAILISYAKTLAYGAAAYEATVQLFDEDSQACEILDLLMANAEGLTGGHLLVNGYVLSQYLE